MSAYSAPDPGSPLSTLGVAEVLLLGLFHGALLGVQVAVLLALADVQLGEVLEGAAGLHAHVVHAPVLEIPLQHQRAASLHRVQLARPGCLFSFLRRFSMR